MNLSVLAKKAVSSSMNLVGLLDWKLRRLTPDNFLILAYHRVLSPSDNLKGVQSGMYVRTETFDRHLAYLQRYFTLSPLSRLPSLLNDPSPAEADKPLCFLTFDDGWKDFYDNAYPLLKKHRAPATVFLPVDYIDSNRLFWTDRFATLLKHHIPQDNETVQADNPLVMKLLRLQGSFENRLEAGITLLKKYRNVEIEIFLKDLSLLLNVKEDSTKRSFMSWSEVEELVKSGIVSVGSHSCSHSIMTLLDENEIRHELETSIKVLVSQGVVTKGFLPFCYPNGAFSETMSKNVGMAGYDLAVTTRKGWNHVGCNPLTLNRISIHEDMTGTNAMYGCKLFELM